MIIAMSTNDRENIVKRTGRAKEFAIYDLETMKVTYKTNTHKHHEHSHDEHEHEHSHDEIVSLFKEFKVDVIIVEMMGSNFKGELKENNIKIYKIKTENKSLDFIALKFKNNPEEFKEIN